MLDAVELPPAAALLERLEEPADELADEPAEELDPALQVPNADWQPVPQWPEVLPQKLYWEQQLPKVEPIHCLPLPEPHSPFVETGRVDVDDAAELDPVADLVPVPEEEVEDLVLEAVPEERVLDDEVEEERVDELEPVVERAEVLLLVLLRELEREPVLDRMEDEEALVRELEVEVLELEAEPVLDRMEDDEALVRDEEEEEEVPLRLDDEDEEVLPELTLLDEDWLPQVPYLDWQPVPQ